MTTPVHTCHWPGCGKLVPPSMWGCKPHWFTLPKKLRDLIWATYIPGQEITKTPSADYTAAARQVQLFCEAYEYGKKRVVELVEERRRSKEIRKP